MPHTRLRRTALPLLLVATAALATLAPAPASGQTLGPPVVMEEEGPPAGPILFWGSYGVGTPFVVGGDPEGGSRFAMLGLERDGKSVMVRVSRVTDPYGVDSDPLDEYALMFGLSAQPSLFHLTASVGIGRVTGFECVDSDEPEECEEAGTFGFPTFLEATFDPLPFLGVGVQAYGNINPDASFGGIGLVGRIGRLR